MTRAIPVADDFDPVPSLERVTSIKVAVDRAPADVGLRAVLVSTGAPLPDGYDAAALSAVGFSAERGQSYVVAGGTPLVLVGAGGEDLDLPGARDLGAAIARSVSSATKIAIDVAAVTADARIIQGLVEGAILARYSWDVLRAEPASTQFDSITIVADGGGEALAAAARRGHLKALATCVSRDLSNCPPAHLTAVRWAAVAERTAGDWGLSVSRRSSGTGCSRSGVGG